MQPMFFLEKNKKFNLITLILSRPPFTASDPMKIYNIILRGIDQLDFPRHVTKV